jgi:hypothetical protein
MANNHGGQTRKAIIEAGYIEGPDGTWSKGNPNLPVRNTRPPTIRNERNPKEKSKRKTRPKKKGEKTNPSGIRYQLFIISYRPRPIDALNAVAGSKWIEDYLVERGLMPDDSIFFCPRPPIIQQIIVPGKEQKTEVFLFQLNDNA